MSASILDRVIDIVSRNAPSSSGAPVEAGTPLTGGGAMTDSVAMLELILELEKEFQIELSADELARHKALENVGRLAACIDAKINAPA
jgi:acyl carrier protein